MIASRLNLFLLGVLLSAPHIAAQQIDSGAHPGERIYVDAVVSPASGPPVENLRQQDFAIFDNDVPQTITSFEAIDARHAQIAVIIVFDTLSLNARAQGTALVDIKRFLNADGGELAYPTTVDFVTTKGLEFRAGPSRDGKAMSALVDKPANATAIQDIKGDPGSYPPFQALAELVALERDKPGRKIILLVSPGWYPTLNPDSHGRPSEIKVQQLRLGMFGNIVQLTRQLHEGQITVYSIDPPVAGDLDDGFTNGVTHLRPDHSHADAAGVRSPSDVRWDDLALQTVAVRSGGLAVYSGRDLTSSLRQCVADISPFYEISFDPVLTDEPNLYHQLKVQVAKPGLTARTRLGYYSQPWPGAKFAAEASWLGEPNAASSQDPATNDRDTTAVGVQDSIPQVPTNVDLPLDQLIKRIPDLKGLHPAEDQKQLPLILERTGHSVDTFVHNIGDLIAREDLTQERLNADGKVKAKHHVQDNYLILHRGYSWGANAEYRMDDKGNRLGQIGLGQGYLVTSGHALSCIQFSTIAQSQSQSRFRFLGTQMLGSSKTYVLAFAQRPGENNFATVMAGTGAKDVEMQTQGILWVDQSNFQILRLRSELLESNREIQLDELTTDVTFAEVRLQDFPNPLWLPSEAVVSIEIGGQKYRNMHRYQDYRRYRVAVKIGTSR